MASAEAAMASAQLRACPVCASSQPVDLIELPPVPVCCNVLWPRREDALKAKRGPMDLKYCGSCGHLFNASYDEALVDYTPAYDSSLHFSAHFSRYAEELARRLAERYALHGRKVVEIGCGKGDFLVLLCEQGGNEGWGFDHSFDPARVGAAQRKRITFSQEFYTPAHAARLRPDFVCFRHVLEHVSDPRKFLDDLRRGFGQRSNAALYCEVPNALFTLKDLGIWDLIYEHCAYFTLGSLAHAARASGFDVLEMGEAFAGQYLYIEMRPGKGEALASVPDGHGAGAVRGHARSFARQYGEKVAYWRTYLRERKQAGDRTAIWGGGSKGVTFLNVLGADSGIEYVVDLSPHKQGRYVPGTGQRIVAPEFLRKLRPTDVIVMNAAYEAEIAASVRALGLNTRLHCA